MIDLSVTSAQNKTMRIHLIGIGGSGLSAIARVLLERGCIVSGSDRSVSPLGQALEAAGAQIMIGHRAENVRGADLVVRSSAVPDDNVEVQAALAAGIPVLKRAQFLSRLMQNQFTIAVAGTHGKTTTSSMIAWVLTRLGQDPSYIIGGTIKNLGGSNAHAGHDRTFVIEADEYDRMFLGLNPDIIVITYLEHDHPDCFPTPQDYTAAFVDFTHRLSPGGKLFVAQDNLAARQLLETASAGTITATYGIDPAAQYTAENVVPNTRGGFDYAAFWHAPNGEKQLLAQVSLQAPGEHNVRNSLAALAVIHALNPGGSDVLHQAAAALGDYTGTGRRFDMQGEVEGVTVVDDYAHHPTEIQATLSAARARYPQRQLWAVWQPHTYSRSSALQADFAHSFSDADRVIVTEVYAAREKAEDFNHFSAAQIVEQMDHPGAQFIPALENVSAYLLSHLQPGDVLLVLSAGNADKISAQVLAGLHAREGHHA